MKNRSSIQNVQRLNRLGKTLKFIPQSDKQTSGAKVYASDRHWPCDSLQSGIDLEERSWGWRRRTAVSLNVALNLR